MNGRASTPLRIPNHGRYAYSALPARLVYAWPGGPQPDVLNLAWRDYGNRVGIWRLLNILDEFALPASVLVNSTIYDHCPEVMDAVRRRGDEVVGHGRSNAERQGVLSEAAERALIAEATATIARREGAPARGWLGPWISESAVTPDLLAEAGYTYLLDWCMDDQPVWLATRRISRILSVPYPQEVNDIPAIVARKDTAAQFADTIVDTFEEMRALSARAPLVMGIAPHPYIVGQPHRARHLRRALAALTAQRDEIWITTSGAIAAHVLGMPAGTIPGDQAGPPPSSADRAAESPTDSTGAAGA